MCSSVFGCALMYKIERNSFNFPLGLIQYIVIVVPNLAICCKSAFHEEVGTSFHENVRTSLSRKSTYPSFEKKYVRVFHEKVRTSLSRKSTYESFTKKHIPVFHEKVRTSLSRKTRISLS